MINTIILSYITFIYFVAFLLYLLMMLMHKKLLGHMATIITILGLVGHTIGLLMRWNESYKLGIGHAPLSNLYESLLFFSWAIIILYIVIEWRTKNKSIGTFATPIAFLAMAYASYLPDEKSSIQPLLPALQSNWLITHVITCFFGYAAFAIAFGLSIMYLLKKSNMGENDAIIFRLIPKPALLDDVSYQMVVIGFLMLTLGIITGSVWAHSAWGRYWNWDPKETWSLITWFVYALLLHSRFLVGWRGKASAVLSIIGFLCVMFTYFGVNYLPGLHSYAQ